MDLLKVLRRHQEGHPLRAPYCKPDLDADQVAEAAETLTWLTLSASSSPCNPSRMQPPASRR